MNFTDIIKGIAPMLATTLAAPLGPLAPLAGMAVSSIIGAVSPEIGAQVTQAQTEGGIQGAIAKVQDLFQQGLINAADIRKAEQAHAERMADLGYKNAADLAAIAAGDRKDARAMEVQTRSGVPAVLAVLITLGFFGILIGMLYGVLKFSDNQALLIMLGALGAAWGAVVNYYFGSSADSGRKTELLAQAPPVK